MSKMNIKMVSPYFELLQVVDGFLSQPCVELCLDLLLDPWVLKCSLGIETLLWVLDHELLDEILCLWADTVPDLAAELPRALFDLCQDLLITAIEWRHATEHDVQNDTDAPQIALLSVSLLEDLRCDVVGRAIHLRHRVIALLVVVTRAKVDHLDEAFVFHIDEDVLRLEVTMSHLLVVTVGDCLQDLLDDERSFVLRNVLARDNLFEQFAAVAELLHEEDAALVLEDLVETHDVRMLQVLEDVDLVLQSDPLLFVQGELVNDLDSALLAIVAKCGFLDGAESSLAKLFSRHLVLVREKLHVLVLDDEVALFGDDIFH